MVRIKSAFLSALGTAFQIGKALADAVLDEGGDADEALRRVITEKDKPKEIAQILTGKAKVVICES